MPEYTKLPEKNGTISAFKTDQDIITRIDSFDTDTRTRSEQRTKLSTKKILKKRHVNHTSENRNVENQFNRSNSENNAIIERTPSNSAQKVPIQKFSFFGLEINVDTLVRLFIVAYEVKLYLNFLNNFFKIKECFV